MTTPSKTILQIPSNVDEKLKLKSSVVHKFESKKKQKIAQGSCYIYELDDLSKPCYFKIDSFVETLDQSKKLIQIAYLENTTYLFQKQNFGICSISFPKNIANFEQFLEIIKRHTTIIEFANAQEQISKNIKANCPDNIQTNDISIDTKSRMKKFGKGLGSLAGKINNAVKKPVNRASATFNQRASKDEKGPTSEETKSKWTNFKQKSHQLNESMTNFVRPALNVFNNFLDSVGTSFHASNNTVIKTIRQYGIAFAESVNEGERLAHPQSEKQEKNAYQETIEQLK